MANKHMLLINVYLETCFTEIMIYDKIIKKIKIMKYCSSFYTYKVVCISDSIVSPKEIHC